MVFLLVLSLRFSLVAILQINSNLCKCDIGLIAVGEDEDEFHFEVLNEIHKLHDYFVSELLAFVVELLTDGLLLEVVHDDRTRLAWLCAFLKWFGDCQFGDG
jgi:hypothetical protein